MRTFQRDRYVWTIERRGNTVTLRWGTVGGKQQVHTQSARHEREAGRLYRRQIQGKRKSGYREVLLEPPSLGAVGQALEAAVVENPDDLVTHMALADWLSEQADPRWQIRGEFIRVQLALEDEKLPPAQMKKLRQRETELIRDYEREWLGPELANAFLDGGGPWPTKDEFYDRPREYRGYRRGWLDWMIVPDLFDDGARTLAAAGCLRLLRRLVIRHTSLNDETFAPLLNADSLANLRVLEMANTVAGENFLGFVAKLPQLEELLVEVYQCDTGQLFALGNLTHLRVLRVRSSDTNMWRFQKLASNPALARLEKLILEPPRFETSWAPLYIGLVDVYYLVHSRYLTNLTHLTLRRSNMGDPGVREIVHSGILARLVELDLAEGTITDEGARLLADCPDFACLKKLNVARNRLSQAGLALLAHPGLELIGANEQVPDGYSHDDLPDRYRTDAFDDDEE